MKKAIFLLIPILFLCSHLFSQEENEKKWAVKAYVNGSFYSEKNSTESNGFIETRSYSEMEIGRISPAIAYSKGKFTQELELVDFRTLRIANSKITEIIGQNVTVPNSGQKNRSVQIGLRYLASAIFRPFKSKNIRLGVGGSVEPYLNHLKSVPYTSATSPVKVYRLGTTISAVPQIEYDFYKRFFINLSSPIEIFDVSLHSRKEGIFSEMKTKDVQSDFFPKTYHLRMGLGVRF